MMNILRKLALFVLIIVTFDSCITFFPNRPRGPQRYWHHHYWHHYRSHRY